MRLRPPSMTLFRSTNGSMRRPGPLPGPVLAQMARAVQRQLPSRTHGAALVGPWLLACVDAMAHRVRCWDDRAGGAGGAGRVGAVGEVRRPAAGPGLYGQPLG